MATTIHPRINMTPEQVEAFCRKWQIVRRELFGSVLRDDFDEQSDIDLLVTLAAEAHFGLFARDLLGREVDLVERQAIDESRNWIRRQSILRSTRLLYAAA